MTGGGNFVLEGAIIADRVPISGTDWDFHGAYVGGGGGASSPEVLTLTE